MKQTVRNRNQRRDPEKENNLKLEKKLEKIKSCENEIRKYENHAEFEKKQRIQ